MKTNKNSTIGNVLHNLKKDWMLYTLLLPMVIWFFMWVYQPLGGLIIAFKDYKPNVGVEGSNFVGLYNFKMIMTGVYAEPFWSAFRNTFLISLYGLIFGFPVPIILAVFFSEITHNRFLKITQTFSYLPHFLSEVTITGLVLTLLYYGESNTGVVANLLYNTGLIEEGTKIMATPDYFRPVYLITGIWKESGYNSIVYFAAIIGVSPSLYEALRVDGGNKLHEVFYVTLPCIAPTLIIMIILRIGKMLTVGYERVILLYNEYTYVTADVLSTFVYRIGLEQGNSSIGASADLFNSLIGFSLVVGANIISRQISKTSLW